MPHVRLDAGAVSESEMTDEIRAMMEAFQYLTPPACGGPANPVHVAVRPTDIRRASDSSGAGAPQMRPGGGDWEDLGEVTGATFAAGMAALGAVRAYIRYDGGHDEGFAYFDHCVFKDGSVRNVERVAGDLEAADAVEFADAREMLSDVVADQWAVQLLGSGYGTGEYKMYGGFWVDLDTGLITDDPDASPRRR
jgi:hypothetical protein